MRGRAAKVRLLLALGWLAAGCATPGPVQPVLDDSGALRAVEHFLEAAGRRDLDSLGRMFGSVQGPITDTGGLGCGLRRLASWLSAADACPSPQEVELRMHAISMVLRHDGYEVVSGESVPGRERPTIRVAVDVRRGDRVYRDVGFVVVRASAGWLVEAVELEKITGR